jgi:hypothetical protein
MKNPAGILGRLVKTDEKRRIEYRMFNDLENNAVLRVQYIIYMPTVQGLLNHSPPLKKETLHPTELSPKL